MRRGQIFFLHLIQKDIYLNILDDGGVEVPVKTVGRVRFSGLWFEHIFAPSISINQSIKNEQQKKSFTTNQSETCLIFNSILLMTDSQTKKFHHFRSTEKLARRHAWFLKGK